MFVTPLDLAREYNYSGLVRLLLARGAVDVDRSYASWDEMWMLLEKAVAAGEMGDGYEPFNSSDVRRDFATMHSMLEQMKTEDGPHAEFLRWCDEHRHRTPRTSDPTQTPDPKPQTRNSKRTPNSQLRALVPTQTPNPKLATPNPSVQTLGRMPRICGGAASAADVLLSPLDPRPSTPTPKP